MKVKQNRKGFTLIELLAVIVILAIIALIATPIILNVINDSRKKAAIDSSYGVIKSIQLAYTQNQVAATPVDTDQTLTFGSDTQLQIGNTNTSVTKVSISGDIPTSGKATLSVSNGSVTFENVKFGNFYCNTFIKGSSTRVCCETSQNCNTDSKISTDQ